MRREGSTMHDGASLKRAPQSAARALLPAAALSLLLALGCSPGTGGERESRGFA